MEFLAAGTHPKPVIHSRTHALHREKNYSCTHLRIQEKDRLKKEMLIKLRETKSNLLKMTDNQLDTTTKRTIAENEQMSSELAWQVGELFPTHLFCLPSYPLPRQSKETEKLIRRNDKLVRSNARSRGGKFPLPRLVGSGEGKSVSKARDFDSD